MPDQGARPKQPGASRVLIRAILVLAGLAAGLAGAPNARAAGDGLATEEIHRRVSASVAIINDIDSHGSGVVLTRDGLILTNYHVVASGISVSVSVDVKEAGKVIRKTFGDVEILKVHPAYDLALIKIDYPKGIFAAARLIGKDEQPVTGSACYAIGNPGGVGEALEHSITEGLVSAASRRIDGLDYIQISAALNPGNSGGAVADDRARVIGIATWKLDQSDNIGFAIPIERLELDDFVPVRKREPDIELGKRYEAEAERFAAMARQLTGEQRVMAIHMATVLYRKCLEAIPGHPAPYNNLGAMYFRLREDRIARKFLEAALEIRPDYASSLSMLGLILERNGEGVEKAVPLWLKGSADPEGGDGAADCVENLAITYFNSKDHARAAYCIRWSNSLARTTPERTQVREQIWNTSVEKISEAQFRSLRTKSGGFSAEGLEAFASGAEGPDDGAGESMEEVPDSVVSIDPGGSADAFIEAAARMADDGVEIPAEGLTKPLPSVPTDIEMGYAGTCLIMKFPDLKRLGVFDLCQAKFVKYISLAENDAIFAAGGKVLMIYYPGENRLEFWDMESWTKKREKTLRTEHRFSAIGMGLLNHRFAFVVRSGIQQPNTDRLALLTIPGCELSVPGFVQSPKGMNLHHLFGHISERTRVHLEEDGSHALVTGSGRGFLNLSNPASVETSYFHGGGALNAGVVLGGGCVVLEGVEVYPSRDETRLFAEAEKNLTQRPDRLALAKVHGYRGVAEIIRDREKDREPMLRLRSLPQLNVTFSTPIDEELARSVDSSRHRESRFFASAYVGRCAYVNGQDKSITLLRIDQEADVASSGPVAPGGLFTRKLAFAEGTKASVDSGPKGLTYDAASGEIRWEIPASQPRGSEVSVIFLLVDADGNESFHIEKIAIP